MEDGRLAPASARWFAMSMVCSGAVEWDPVGWELAMEVGLVLAFWLNDRRKGEVIGAREVEEMLLDVANSMGIEMRAETIQLLAPPVEINLLGLVELAGSSYELAFFSMLKEQILEALQSGVQFIECVESRRAIKKLLGFKTWNPKCQQFLQQVVEFVQGIPQQFPHEGLTIQLR